MSSNLYSAYWRPSGMAIFTSSQNWTVPPGVFKIKVLCIGSGGGGGGGYSSSYSGGGGGSGSIGYAEVIVQPGITLAVEVAAGGSGGTGGSSPTAGGGGATSQVTWPALPGKGFISGQGGGGGGAASSSANGSAGSGGGIYAGNVSSYGNPFYAVASYMIAGNAGSGSNGGTTPQFAPGFASTSNVPNGFSWGTVSQNNVDYGQGGQGGGPGGDGTPGIQGAVMIWWGDD